MQKNTALKQPQVIERGEIVKINSKKGYDGMYPALFIIGIILGAGILIYGLYQGFLTPVFCP